MRSLPDGHHRTALTRSPKRPGFLAQRLELVLGQGHQKPGLSFQTCLDLNENIRDPPLISLKVNGGLIRTLYQTPQKRISIKVFLWKLLKQNPEEIKLLISLLSLCISLLSLCISFISFYRTRPKRDVLKFEFSKGEYHRFKRGSVLRCHLKIDFKLTALNSDAYVKQVSISKTQPGENIRLLLFLRQKRESLNIKNIYFYLRNCGSSPSIIQEGWEYNVNPTPELPLNKILLDSQIQYRSISGSRKNHDSFRDAWGRIKLTEWTDLKSPLLIEKNSRRHVTILCEITFNEDMESEVCAMFPDGESSNFDIRFLFNSTESVEKIKLQPARIE